jgi:hypothetical protein
VPRASKASGVSAWGTGDDGDKRCRPTKPDEPPVHIGCTRAGQIETRMLGVSKGIEGAGEFGDEERQLGIQDEPPDEAQVEFRDHRSIQVEPGGKTHAK